MDQITAVAGARAGPALNSFGQLPAARKRLEERLQPRRLPARCRDEGAVEERLLAIAQGLAIGPVDQAPGREKHGVSGGGVPLTGRRGARIDVRPPFGEKAEFE